MSGAVMSLWEETQGVGLVPFTIIYLLVVFHFGVHSIAPLASTIHGMGMIGVTLDQ